MAIRLCYSYPVRMTSVRVSSTSIVVICVALKPIVYYVLRGLTVKTSSCITQCICFAHVTYFIGKDWVISGFCDVIITVRCVATLWFVELPKGCFQSRYFRTIMIQHWYMTSLFMLVTSQKIIFFSKAVKVKFYGSASSGVQGTVTYLM